MIEESEILELAKHNGLRQPAMGEVSYAYFDLIAFAQAIAQRTRNECASACSGIHRGFIADDSDAWLCIKVIGSMK